MERTDPETLDEVHDPIADDETEVVETGEENERAEGEDLVAHEAGPESDEIETGREEAEVSISEADGAETET